MRTSEAHKLGQEVKQRDRCTPSHFLSLEGTTRGSTTGDSYGWQDAQTTHLNVAKDAGQKLRQTNFQFTNGDQQTYTSASKKDFPRYGDEYFRVQQSTNSDPRQSSIQLEIEPDNDPYTTTMAAAFKERSTGDQRSAPAMSTKDLSKTHFVMGGQKSEFSTTARDAHSHCASVESLRLSNQRTVEEAKRKDIESRRIKSKLNPGIPSSEAIFSASAKAAGQADSVGLAVREQRNVDTDWKSTSRAAHSNFGPSVGAAAKSEPLKTNYNLISIPGAKDDRWSSSYTSDFPKHPEGSTSKKATPFVKDSVMQKSDCLAEPPVKSSMQDSFKNPQEHSRAAKAAGTSTSLNTRSQHNSSIAFRAGGTDNPFETTNRSAFATVQTTVPEKRIVDTISAAMDGWGGVESRVTESVSKQDFETALKSTKGDMPAAGAALFQSGVTSAQLQRSHFQLAPTGASHTTGQSISATTFSPKTEGRQRPLSSVAHRISSVSLADTSEVSYKTETSSTFTPKKAERLSATATKVSSNKSSIATGREESQMQTTAQSAFQSKFDELWQ